MAKLTKTFLEMAQPPASSHAMHRDGGLDRAVKGYGLRVLSLGERVFVAAGRVRGNQLQFTIEPFGHSPRTRRDRGRAPSSSRCARASTSGT